MCGLVGLWFKDKVGDSHVKAALNSLKHRGNDGIGIAPPNMELSRQWLGHIRYATQGSTEYTHPVRFNSFYLAFNGTIEIPEDKDLLPDTYLLGYTIGEAPSIKEGLIHACKELKGAFTCIILEEDGTLYAFRDPYGMKPLCLGAKESTRVFASESCVFNDYDVEFIRDLAPGELVTIKPDGTARFDLIVQKEQLFDPFELVYFARGDSVIDGIPVANFRLELGDIMAHHDNFDNIPSQDRS
jgi:amidophosphoribosyltransferase